MGVFTKNSIKSKTITIKHSVETQYNFFTNFLTTNLLLINLKQLQDCEIKIKAHCTNLSSFVVLI